MAAPKDAQMYRWAFTWNKPLTTTEDDFKAQYQTVLEMCKQLCKKYIFQLERAPTTGLLHYQGYVSRLTKISFSNMVKETQEYMPAAHLSICSTAGELALKTYCMKKETFVAGPWADKELAEENLRARIADELKYVPEAKMTSNPYPWQATLLAELDQEPGDRRVVWVCDQLGNSGKSTFVKWQRSVQPEYRAAYRFAKATDISHMVLSGGPRKVYFFDLTRSKPHELGHEDLYSAIESVKDGYVVSGKYKGGELMMKPPHVFVFSNQPPAFHCLSTDRWDVRYIRADKTLVRSVNEHVCGDDCTEHTHSH